MHYKTAGLAKYKNGIAHRTKLELTKTPLLAKSAKQVHSQATLKNHSGTPLWFLGFAEIQHPL
jgi:hypothetical protein